MNIQTTLFDDDGTGDPLDHPVSLPYVKQSATSKAAAADAFPRAGTKRRIVLDFIAGQGDHGATDEEVQTYLDLDASTQRPRRVELQRAGLVIKTDATRPTRSGSSAGIYVATAKGRAGS